MASTSIDWDLCIFCQETTNEELRNPCNSKGATYESIKLVYEEFLHNLRKLEDAGSTSFVLDHSITAENMLEEQACWHKSCKKPYKKYTVMKTLSNFLKRDTDKDMTIQPSKRRSLNLDNCLFCEKTDGKEKLHYFSSLDCDDIVKTMATDLQDTELMVKLAGPDLVAKGANYHKNCLTHLYTKHRSHIRAKNRELPTREALIEARALLELQCYIKESLEEGQHIFKLADLQKLYSARLEQYGINQYIHSTRLKKLILQDFPEAQEQSDGKYTIIIFPEGMRTLLKEAMKTRDQSWKAKILIQAAKIVREEALHEERRSFDGSFSTKCQESYVTPALKHLVSLILNGVNISDELDDSQANLTIGQLLIFNMRKKCVQQGKKTYHKAIQEPPVCSYLGLLIHATTRSKQMIQKLNHLGLGPSYDRIMKIENQLTSAVCERYKEDGVVAPSSLQKGRFCIAAIDNIDYNPSSTTSKESFHGTSISMFQLGETDADFDLRRKVTIPTESTLTDLPEAYSIVPCIEVQTTGMKVPWRALTTDPNSSIDKTEILMENKWLLDSSNMLDKTLTKEDRIAWSAYHAARRMDGPSIIASNALFPLFYDKAATLSMMKHGMDVIRAAVNFLNPGQIPIMTCDQPLFALAKKVQWKFPDIYGEDEFVIWPGGLHFEMACWSVVGDLLENTGWDTLISESEVATPGVAKSFLKVSHLMRTRNAHQVTILALFILRKKAWEDFREISSTCTFLEWVTLMKEKSATFYFWDMIFKLEQTVLLFIRAHREKKFTLYIQTVKEMMPYFFSLDHVNYARWFSVHIRDLSSLPGSVFDQFYTGNWVVPKTLNHFSSMPVDQAHEQENKVVKGSGGIIGLTENPHALKRWMVAGPEISRSIREFEQQTSIAVDDSEESMHHQEGLSAQVSFQRQVGNLVEVILDKGNPFLDEFQELIAIDSRKVFDSSISQSIRSIINIGKKQYTQFYQNVLEDRTSSIDEPIKRNNFPLPKNPRLKVKSKQTKKLKDAQISVEIFGQLYMAHRESDKDKFFCHELQSFPAALADSGKMYFPTAKSALLPCLTEKMDDTLEVPQSFDCILLDGAAIVHFLPTDRICTFRDYAQKVFIPYLKTFSCSRIDIVFDQYLVNSLKNAVREKRGDGTRWKVGPQVKVPKKWNDFLNDSQNKKELFSFLAREVHEAARSFTYYVYVTLELKVFTNSTTNMSDCTHEEADTRIIVHLMNGLKEGYEYFLIRTVDTDIVVILLGKYHDIQTSYPATDIWIKFGTGKSVQYFHLKSLYEKLGITTCRALPYFHAFTGCDTTSAFKGKAKKSAWQTWKAYKQVTDSFEDLSQNPFKELNDESRDFQVLQKFVVQMYSKGLDVESVNVARKLLFAQNQKMERIPPTADALLQHAKRAIYQTGKDLFLIKF